MGFFVLWDTSTSFVKFEKHTVRSDTCFNFFRFLSCFFGGIFVSSRFFSSIAFFISWFLFPVRKRKHVTTTSTMSAVKNVGSSILPVIGQYAIVVRFTFTQSISCVGWDSSKRLSPFSGIEGPSTWDTLITRYEWSRISIIYVIGIRWSRAFRCPNFRRTTHKCCEN